MLFQPEQQAHISAVNENFKLIHRISHEQADIPVSYLTISTKLHIRVQSYDSECGLHSRFREMLKHWKNDSNVVRGE